MTEKTKKRGRPKTQFLVIDVSENSYSRIVVDDEEKAIEVADEMENPIVISGLKLKFHTVQTKLSLLAQPLETETGDEKDDSKDTPEPVGFAIKQGDNNKWITDEGLWGEFSDRLIYESEKVANEVASRVTGVVIPI